MQSHSPWPLCGTLCVFVHKISYSWSVAGFVIISEWLQNHGWLQPIRFQQTCHTISIALHIQDLMRACVRSFVRSPVVSLVVFVTWEEPTAGSAFRDECLDPTNRCMWRYFYFRFISCLKWFWLLEKCFIVLYYKAHSWITKLIIESCDLLYGYIKHNNIMSWV